MDTGIKVGDLMTRNFIYESPEKNLRECAKKMIKKRVGSLIIKEGDKLLGILTEKDIVWAVVKESKCELEKIKAKDLMKKKVVTIKPSADITEALSKFKKKKVRKLPVVENGKVIGMLTMKDVIRIDPGLFELIAETVQIKEESKKIKTLRQGNRKPGICEECGDFTLLSKQGAQWICDDCFNKR